MNEKEEELDELKEAMDDERDRKKRFAFLLMNTKIAMRSYKVKAMQRLADIRLVHWVFFAWHSAHKERNEVCLRWKIAEQRKERQAPRNFFFRSRVSYLEKEKNRAEGIKEELTSAMAEANIAASPRSQSTNAQEPFAGVPFAEEKGKQLDAEPLGGGGYDSLRTFTANNTVRTNMPQSASHPTTLQTPSASPSLAAAQTLSLPSLPVLFQQQSGNSALVDQIHRLAAENASLILQLKECDEHIADLERALAEVLVKQESLQAQAAEAKADIKRFEQIKTELEEQATSLMSSQSEEQVEWLMAKQKVEKEVEELREKAEQAEELKLKA
ncbi:uncharacterized protein MONOS_6603 [Monocercomonoides exilis]|uniref:uncharacterized protein n=1 Tax=Monocercomonoides exilis TaxID=2049356 RepID=UPI00355A36A6|nr:hypothetical protein MONOS_6603 [Monocercomonoides exilis]|eukprot:MONOS_6603.1-p1 / transcript=MONOS_6603.1 / gene=MONOS_6603 / organism=Monocercomonoides_exilis_PA203 / gene_product=unspecified product / transcript_product=unspecified product / location=Mono_scaffold00211:8424-9673(-) / protein_length=328 / sequence_SO=supercontig / SO=protein_coding / is_pseudo=false